MLVLNDSIHAPTSYGRVGGHRYARGPLRSCCLGLTDFSKPNKRFCSIPCSFTAPKINMHMEYDAGACTGTPLLLVE